jgi:2-succinyl-6-hydroxy-2,4-cyclohexadiene-1-carboxylate synthase
VRRFRFGPPGERIVVYDHGRGEGDPRPALLCLHGFTGSARAWQPFVGRFGRRWRVLAVDALGHGAADAPVAPVAYDLWRGADRLAAAIAALAGGRSAVLGYSMGGRQALCLALAHPAAVASLVLEGASPGIQDAEERARRRAADEAWAQLVEQRGVAAFVDAWEAQALFASQVRQPERRRRALRLERLAGRAVGLAGSLRGAGAGVQDDLWPRLGEIRAPVLYVAGALDARYAAIGARVAAAVADGRLAVVPNAGHSVHWERPAAFARALEAFWAGLDPAPPPP